MSDLVERLRETADMNIDWPPQPSLIRRAADEIERLQKQIFALRASEIANQTLYRETKRMAEIEANNERLEARVTDLESDLAAKAELVEMLLAEKRAGNVPNP